MSVDTPPKPSAKRETCPTCGASLPDVPVSLCPYCASPLETREDREQKASIHAARIGKIAGHADYAAALEWTPPESRDWARGKRKAWWGLRLGVSGVALAVLGAVTSGGAVLTSPLFWLGLGVTAWGVSWSIKGRQMQAAAVAQPVLKRPALILDRRSETAIRGWTGDTTYFFRIEFEDGIQGEFAYPGLGAQDEPYANNLPGVAYTRGPVLLHFRHIRV